MRDSIPARSPSDPRRILPVPGDGVLVVGLVVVGVEVVGGFDVVVGELGGVLVVGGATVVGRVGSVGVGFTPPEPPPPCGCPRCLSQLRSHGPSCHQLAPLILVLEPSREP